MSENNTHPSKPTLRGGGAVGHRVDRRPIGDVADLVADIAFDLRRRGLQRVFPARGDGDLGALARKDGGDTTADAFGWDQLPA